MSDAGGLRYRGAGGTGAVDGPRPPQEPQLDATPKKPGAAKKASEEFGINWRALALFIGVPPLLLVGVVLLWQGIFTEPVAATPCAGVCEITPALAAAAPAGCAPVNPFQLFYPHVPKTAGTTMEALIDSRKHLKEFELVKLQEWRDAAPGGVIWLPPSQLNKRSHLATYEDTYRATLHSTVYTARRKHRSIFFGHVFFHDFRQPLVQKAALQGKPYALDHEHLGITVLREPLARLASQYRYDRKRAKSKQFQRKVIEEQGNLPFAACAASKDCIAKNDLSRWCSLQTRYICGWGPDCTPNEIGGATPKMLARAKKHLEDLFVVVGVQEQWDLTLKLLEKKLPTYFEGVAAEYRAGNEANCARGRFYKGPLARWWKARAGGAQAKCPYRQNTVNRDAKDSLPAKGSQGDMHLKALCWADIELYEYAIELMAAQAAACFEAQEPL